MKFADKIIYSCLLVIVVVYTLGSTIMIVQNHNHLLETVTQQNKSSHEIESYSIESRLLQDASSDTTSQGKNSDVLLQRAIYYIQQFHSSIEQPLVSYALLGSNNQILYSKIDKDIEENVIKNKNEHYAYTTINSQNYMIISSEIKAGEQKYSFLGCYNITPTFEERTRQFYSSLYIGIFVLGLSYFILRALARYLTSSILKLNTVSQRIAAGNYSERTCIDSHDEIGELSKSFDEMAETNEQTIHELQHNVQQREDFMGSFSHEIKTPMTAILGFADMMRTYDCDSESRQKAAQYIYTEGKRLETLSYALMDLLSLDQQHVEFEPISITSIMKQLDYYYEGKKLDINIVFDYQECLLNSQDDLLFALMRNLIDNAIKASSSQQEILIKGYVNKDRYIIIIQDHGIGMSQEDIEKVTEPFYMADKSRARSQGGAGLGLSLVKRICDVHHTKLTITSILNQGTTVSFDIGVYQDE
ncbi:MAG: HAMP domain-containing sensor histidine kinase [Coprobacillus sp.]